MPPDRTIKQDTTDDSTRPLAQSCVQCRTRKIKCNSAKPQCSNCQAIKSDCEYRIRQKPGLRAGVGSELLQRVSVLEEALEVVHRRLAEVTSRLDSSGPPTVGAASTTTPASIATANSGELMPPPPAHDFHNQPVDHPTTGSNLSNQATTPQQPLPSEDLPPHDLLITLFDLFFNHVAPWAPFVQRDAVKPVLTPEGTYEWPITVYGIVVACLRFSFDPRWDSLPPKSTFRDRAKNRVVMHSMSTTSVASIEALALVALDDLGANTTPEAWGALALTTRTAVHMSLHREEANTFIPAEGVSPMQLLGRSMCFAEEEGRRRLFWAIYMLDRWSATATGWDFAFPDVYISRRLPCVESAWKSDSATVTPFFRSPFTDPRSSDREPGVDEPLAALIEITDLLGQVHQFHRKKLDAVDIFREGTVSLETSIAHWFESLPATLRVQPKSGNDAQTVLVQALHWATVIKLQSLLAYPLLPNLTPNTRAAEKAHNASKRIAGLAKLATVHSAYLSWTFFVGARMFLLRAYRRSEPVDPAVQDILRGLREAATYFDLAGRYHAIINRAIKRLHSIDGTLGGASALVDLHHTAFSAESAMLPSGTVTPMVVPQSPVDMSHFHPHVHHGIGGGVNHGLTSADLLNHQTLTNGHGGGGGDSHSVHSSSSVHGNGTASAGGNGASSMTSLWATGVAGSSTWLDNDLLGHSFESWFDLPAEMQMD